MPLDPSRTVAELRVNSRPEWLALVREDHDPARFWAYVVEALRTASAEIGDAALTALRVPGTGIDIGLLSRQRVS